MRAGEYSLHVIDLTIGGRSIETMLALRELMPLIVINDVTLTVMLGQRGPQ